MKGQLHAVAFTEAGMETGRRIRGLTSLVRCPRGGLADWTAAHWEEADGLLFIGAAGIAVRAIAPFVQKKTMDPAVVVIDEKGHFVIPLLSGHIGGANAWAAELAAELQAVPVITTATDLNGVFAVDTWAVSQGLAIRNPERIRQVSAKLLAGERIGLYSELPVAGRYPDGVTSEEPYDVVISPFRRDDAALHLIPRCVTLGIGCRKGTPEEAIEALFQKCGPEECSVTAVCSIDLKAEEPGLLAFCGHHGFPFRTASASALRAVPGAFTGSEFVRSVTGVENVCERAAVWGGGRLLLPKTAENGVTMAAAMAEVPLHFPEL
ncbi:MAG: cobalamin biosynthesis protein [Lachnospiraceae bacterium]|nr:cobalamin biosynthesis protein [Lachnospiraceae bacterium]